jgi:nitrogen-specific signal transduction histidine kinase
MVELLCDVKVAIVDDDPDFVKILSSVLKKSIQLSNPIVLESIRAAREFFEHRINEFWIIFLDEHLKDGLGSSLLESGVLNDFDVISISSDTSQDLVYKQLSNGAVYFINKAEVPKASFSALIVSLLRGLELRRRKSQMDLHFKGIETARKLIARLQHEINNPLGAVIGSINLLSSNRVNEEDRQRAVQIIQEAFERIKEVLGKLKNLSLFSPNELENYF